MENYQDFVFPPLTNNKILGNLEQSLCMSLAYLFTVLAFVSREVCVIPCG